MLLDIMKINNITVEELAKELDVSTSQIYTWNRKGINKNHRCWNILHAKFPALKPKETKHTIKDIPDKRTRNQRPRKGLVLTDVDIQEYKEESRKSSLFPTIKFKSTK